MKKRKKILEYTVLLSPDLESGGFTVEVPALPGCVTDGATVKQAEANAIEAIQLYINSLVERGFSVPHLDCK